MRKQVVFRHKAWLPWWVMLLVPFLILLALLLFLFLPRNVVVPDVVGAKSAFEAEQKLTEAQLKPAAGEKAKKDSEVEILVAVGNGKVRVPKITGLRLAAADKVLRAAQLTVGQIQPQPPDLTRKIESQIPAANETVRTGTPISVFVAKPAPPARAKGRQGKKAAAGGP